MPRSRRLDPPGGFHHVMGRALNRKPIFETRRDIRFFLACLARAVRRGEVEVHAYVVLTTHFHLLLSSPRGQLSEAMRRVLGEYAQYFNRTRDRDGPLWRGRFTSKRVTSYAYRCAVVRYIDQNPVQAGLAALPWHYAYGSALHYTRDSGPRWLAREWIEREARGHAPAGASIGEAYLSSFGARAAAGLENLVECRLASPSSVLDPLDDLIEAAPERVRAWMRRQAAEADRTKPGSPVVPAALVESLIAEHSATLADFWVRPRRRRFSGLATARVALLRDLAGLTYAEIARRVSRTQAGLPALYADHVYLLRSDERYASLFDQLATQILQRTL